MKRILLLYLISIFIQSVNAEDNIKFHYLGFEDGLSQMTIRSLYQDEKGAIWLGTNEELKRYNGNNFEEVHISSAANQILSNIVYSITGDHKGHLFFKTDRNEIIEYDLRSETSQIIYPADKNDIVINYGKDHLWLAVKNQIFAYKNQKISLYKELSDSSLQITSIKETTNGKLTVSVYNSGIYSIDQKGIQTHIFSTHGDSKYIFEDTKHRLWIGTDKKGVFLIENNKIIKKIQTNSPAGHCIANNFITAICDDNNGNIWIGTISGLDCFDIKTELITHYGVSNKNQAGLSHPSVFGLIKDNQGTIWVATFYGGINFFNPAKDLFDNSFISDLKSTRVLPIISQIAEDNNQNLWICSDGDGLIKLNRKNSKLTYYREGQNSVIDNNLKSIYYDKTKDLLWLGTNLNSLNCLNLKTGKFSYMTNNPVNKDYMNQSIQVIAPYKDYLYLGTYLGVICYNTITGNIEANRQLSGKFRFVKDILIDDKENVWIASNGLYQYNLKTKKYKSFHDIIKYSNASTTIQISDLYQDSKKRIWLATAGAGVVCFHPENNKFEEYNKLNSGLANNFVSSISELKSGKMIVGTNSGFSILDVEQRKSYNYNSKNGFPIKSMMNGSILKRSNGEIILGGIGGMCFFDEASLSLPEQTSSIRFDKLLINNKIVTPNDQTGVLKVALPYTSKIELNYKQKILSIEVATDNYIKNNQQNFQYKLENYDKEWVNFDIKSPINFMNLPSGTYLLKVRKNILQKANLSDEIHLEIDVLPPFYVSWYAYLIYLILTLSIVLWIVNFYRSRLMLQTTLLIERKDKEQRELANQSKLRFFTYISHEFRTPVTLIISQLELLMQSTKIATRQYKEIVSLHRNATKLTLLINELLDFRKQEQGFMKLKVNESNVVEYIREIYMSFVEYAKSKNITLTFSSDKDVIDCWFDDIQLQKVFYNLISNAFKYTNSDGFIHIEIKENAGHVTVSVSDNGIGISSESIDKVFEQFYQDEKDNMKNPQNPGTGLGLALSKGIVELHSGKIEVESELNKGSVFTVTLPCGNSHFIHQENVEIIEKSSLNEDYIVGLEPLDEVFLEEVTETHRRRFEELPTLLVVEDNDDLRQILMQIFKSMYQVLEARNGLEGYATAKEQQPDLIVSDVMMPVMSGTEMCSKLKNDFETSHIPIVLLTAQTTVEQNIAGLKSGADDYVGKPFNVKILIMRCNNLLNGRKILQEKYTKKIDTNPNTIVNNSIDQAFIEKAVKIIEKNITDQKIDVDFLCSEMAIGRRVFFSKMKIITGQTPNDFILSVKFKIAAKMLKNDLNKNVSEISDELGFSSAKYFGKCFKEQFGISPTQMRDELTEK